MEIYTKVTGKTEKPTAMEFSLIQTAVCMKEIGWMINNMVREQNHGITKKSNIQEISQMEKRQDRVVLSLKEVTMKENFQTVNLMEKEFTTFQILVKFMKGILKKIIWTELDL